MSDPAPFPPMDRSIPLDARALELAAIGLYAQELACAPPLRVERAPAWEAMRPELRNLYRVRAERAIRGYLDALG